MPKLSHKLTLVLIIFLSSCKDQFPIIEPQTRCVVVLQSTLEDSYCRCHLYEWTADRIGRVNESTNYPIQKCDKLIGFEPDTYVSIYTWWESIRLWLNRHK